MEGSEMQYAIELYLYNETEDKLLRWQTGGC